MLNFKQLRAQRRDWDNESTPKMPFNPLLMACLAFILALMMCGACHAKNANISEIQAIRALIGEGESESLMGMTALGEVIRTRGSFKGIYGYNAVKYVNGRYYRGKRAIAPAVVSKAVKAWRMSASTNYSLQADGWGNASDLVIFKRSKWFKNCYITVKIGAHYFWKARA